MHISSQGLTWEAEEVEGDAPCSFVSLPVEGVTGVGGALKFRMGKGIEFKYHRHRDWVAVTILSGKVRVAPPGGAEPSVYEAGDVYLVEPGSLHQETMLEDTEVVVVHGPGVTGEQFDIHTTDV